jgi:hypothetical protein
MQGEERISICDTSLDGGEEVASQVSYVGPIRI